MSNEKKENNNGSPRKRPKLYKKDEKEEDVLKKLKEVRQNLQDSLDDGPRAKPTRKRGERKLYKKEEAGVSAPVKPTVSKRKVEKRVSSRRLATVQKRVKERMESTKRLSKGKKVAILIFMIVLSLPLFLITSLAVIGLEFNFSDFGLIYNENKPGTITLSFGARNPSFLPAHLGQFEIELYTDEGEYIGKAYNNDELDIAPYQTEKLFVTLSLDKDKGGAWLADLLSDLKLSMNIGKLTYNGIGMEVDFLPTIELDIQPLIRDAIGGLLDIEELLEGLSLEDLLGSSNGATMSADGSKITVDPYSNAKSSSLIPRLSQFGDDMTANVSFAMTEDTNSFDLGLSATINLNDLVSAEDLGGIVLGPIKINNLDVQLMVNNNTLYEDATAIKNDDNWYEHYTTPIAKLFSVKHNPKASDELAIFIADNKNRDSFIGMNLSIFKDNPALLRDGPGGKYHPSQDIDWKAEASDPNSIESFLAGGGAFSDIGGPAWKRLPGWMFLYNLLGLGKLDCGIKIENADINIFGLDINGVSLPMSVLPPLVVDEGVLSPENLLRVGPDYGVLGMMKHFVKGITETPARGFLGLPEPSAGVPEEQSLDDLLNQVVEMIEFPNINLDDIEENIGENLHLELPISINNTMLNFFMGFDNMTIGIGSEINEITRSFIELKISGNNSETVYFPGIGSFVTVNVELDIKTDFQSQPFATKFLANLIENYTIDGVITAGFDKLMLFKENYTYGRFEIAIPLVLDIESILMDLVAELVPGLIGGLVETDDGGNETEQQSTFPGSPLSVLMAVNPMMGLISALGDAPKLLDAVRIAQQEETTEAEDDFLSDTINGLIESLLGGLLGEMEFTLGLEVEVDPGDYTKFTITLTDFLIEDMFITIGMADTLLTVQSKNAGGEWEDMIGLEVEDYFEIREGVREDIKLSLYIYETNALCTFINDFIDEFFNQSLTNTVDLQIAGYTTVNVSGLYMPDLDILFTLEEMDLGLNGTELRDGLFDMIYELELDAETGEPKEEVELLDLWAGSLRDVPIISQGIDLESLISLGAISIEEISETHFNETNEGIGKISLGMVVTNYLMSMNIEKFNIDLYEYHPDIYNPPHNKLMRISIGDGENGLSHAGETKLSLNITMYKSTNLQNWINTLITTLQPSGYVNLSTKVNVFGCDIEVKSSYLPFLNLTMLPIDVTTLLSVMTPFTGPFLELTGPQTAQDIDMDSIMENVFNFGIGKIKIGGFSPVGPLDYVNPMFNLGMDLWFEPKFNMSIDAMKLQLLDGDLYKALYEYGGLSFEDTAKEAAVAEIILNKQAFFNSCNPGTLEHDWQKPYLVNRSNSYHENENSTEWTVDEGVDFVLDQDDLDPVYGRTVGLNATQFNETGYTPNNYLYLQKPTLNNLSLTVNLLNKSHGTWATRYDRKYWKALGSAYFMPKMYDGYPDHRMDYENDMVIGYDEDGRRIKIKSPSAYSPLVGIISKAMALLDEEGIATDPEALKTLISGIALGGYVNITMFSMELCINLNNPRINSLFEPISGLFLTTTAYTLKSYIREVTTPLNERQAPKEQALEHVMTAQGIDAIFGDILDMGSIPLDIYDVVQGISFPGIVDRTNHFYSTQTDAQTGESRCWDGTEKWADQEKYLKDPRYVNKYTGGLDSAFFNGSYDGVKKETFYKDHAYEWFKTVTDNWATGNNVANPYFEDHYSYLGYNDRVFYQLGDKIEDPKNWPLVYDYQAFGGRCRTGVITLHTGALLEFPVGVLSGQLGLWIENPYEPCEYMPMGYAWVNSSVHLMPIRDFVGPSGIKVDGILNDSYVSGSLDTFLEPGQSGRTYAEIKAYYEENGTLGWDQDSIDVATLALCQAGVNGSTYGMDEFGNVADPGWVINFNIRFFEGIGSYEFWWQMIQGGDFNIHFLAQGFLNVSLFGYEFYNLFLPYDIAQLGDPSRYQSKCDRYLENQGGGGYGDWGIPTYNGTLTGETYEEEDESYYPHYLLKQPTLSFAVSLPIDAILDFEAFLDLANLLDLLLGSLTFQGSSLVFPNVQVPIENPVPLALFITKVYIGIEIGVGETYQEINWGSPDVLAVEVESPQNIPLMDLGEGHYGNPEDPYDFRYNAYDGWHTPHPVELVIDASLPLDIGILLGAGWEALIGTVDLWIWVKELKILALAPNSLDYNFELVIDLGDIEEPMHEELSIMDLLGGL